MSALCHIDARCRVALCSRRTILAHDVARNVEIFRLTMSLASVRDALSACLHSCSRRVASPNVASCGTVLSYVLEWFGVGDTRIGVSHYQRCCLRVMHVRVQRGARVWSLLPEPTTSGSTPTTSARITRLDVVARCESGLRDRRCALQRSDRADRRARRRGIAVHSSVLSRQSNIVLLANPLLTTHTHARAHSRPCCSVTSSVVCALSRCVTCRRHCRQHQLHH